MRLLQGVRPGSLEETSAPEVAGLAGWLLALVRGWRGQRECQQKQLQLVETLPLGGKRQLMLVRCAGESFLVGGSFESVETIVRLRAETSLEHTGDRMEERCV
ncbi:flagellar biosynthetic protein FliO [Tunturibacter empetritectus]|uniref:Flagellar biogenesis protein FliO n=1 Tax=Tunturiibacter empetritectus TaxID=3069691 RepID=A0A7W8MQE7_9BACT|nr:flagellar biosynthetic protein FliO [Edaphobacter lichenicola]MBB5315730.1 flagellar biogenesis protein FliO [Edaphobacter lichenicola]